MRNLSRALHMACACILVAGAAHAQAMPAPPPGAPVLNADAAPPPPLAGPDADAPPPPPPGGPGHRPPPPPRGAAFMIDRGLNGTMRVDVKCAERDSTKDCANITSQFIEKLNAETKTR